MNFFDRLPGPLKNKYLLTVLCVLVWMLFFDDRDIITAHFRQPNELKKLEESREFYLEKIRLTREELDQLRSNTGTIEKFAREKYNMKRDNEDLFIIADKK